MFARIVCLLTALLTAPVLAQDVVAGAITVSHPYARETPPGAQTGAAYFTLKNAGKTPDTLRRVDSAVAAKTELHQMSMDNGMMRMREVGSVTVGAGKTLQMRPGNGYHVMFINLKQALKAGDSFPLTLEFAQAGKVTVTVTVEKRDAKDHDHKH